MTNREWCEFNEVQIGSLYLNTYHEVCGCSKDKYFDDILSSPIKGTIEEWLDKERYES